MAMRALGAAIALALTGRGEALDNGVGLTPASADPSVTGSLSQRRGAALPRQLPAGRRATRVAAYLLIPLILLVLLPCCCIPVGYNTWDDFRCGGINNTNVMKVADAIVRYGLDKVGYEYLGLDDCWATSRDEQTGVIVPDPKAFPDGMKAVADYVHKKGLKFGICTLPHAVCSARCLPRCRSAH